MKTAGAISASLEGNVALAQAKTPFDLSLKSESMRYPFAPQQNGDVLSLENIAMRLNGNLLLDYALEAKVSAKGMGVPASSASLTGKGELTHFNIQDLSLNTLEGTAKTTVSGLERGVAWRSKF